MTPFTDDQKAFVADLMQDQHLHGVSSTASSICGVLIDEAARTYFRCCGASDSNAAQLVDRIYAALSAVEMEVISR